MDMKQIELIYQKIANKIIGIIPVDWSKVYLYAEVLDDSTEVYFYFNPKDRDELVYSNNIPSIYQVDEKTYEKLLFEIFALFREMHNEFKKNGEELWTNLTLILERTGKFKINYDYQDILNSGLTPSQRNTIWEYKYLGRYPSSERKRKLVDEYIKEHQDEKE